MMINIDEVTKVALKSIGDKVAEFSGMKPRNTSIVAQTVLLWACEHIADQEIKTLTPKMLSVPQRRKALLSEMRTVSGQMDAARLEKLMRAIHRIKNTDEKEPEKETTSIVTS